MTEPLLLGADAGSPWRCSSSGAWRSDRDRASWTRRSASTGRSASCSRSPASPATKPGRSRWSALAGAVLARRASRSFAWRGASQVDADRGLSVAAIAGFVVFSRVVVGAVVRRERVLRPREPGARPSAGAAANRSLGRAGARAARWTTVVALVGLLGLLARGLLDRRRRVRRWSPLALAAAAALPWVAFLEGHPFRIRYMVPLLAAQAIGVGAAAGRWRQAAPVAAARADDRRRPRARAAGRARADGRRSAVGSAERRGAAAGHRLPRRASTTATTIMASMGSLGHYMQELSRRGFAIRDFLHEGNGDIWLGALDRAAAVRRLDADRGDRRRAATCWRDRAREPRVFSTGSRASAKAPASRSIGGTRRRRSDAAELRT